MKKIKVNQPFNDNVITFESLDDFNVYYNENEDEFEGVSTQKLNKKFKIIGYTLSRRTNKEGIKEIVLNKSYYKSGMNKDVEDLFNKVNEKINTLEEESLETKNKLTKLIEYLVQTKVIDT
jgi:NCAIR mutase (PurE)-related protein